MCLCIGAVPLEKRHRLGLALVHRVVEPQVGYNKTGLAIVRRHGTREGKCIYRIQLSLFLFLDTLKDIHFPKSHRANCCTLLTTIRQCQNM